MLSDGFKRLVAIARDIASLLIIALAAVSLIPRVFGYMPYAVLSGSMEPELPVGSMVSVHEVEPPAIAVGDAATFYRSDGAVVTHQVYEIDPVAQTIGTQGIANKNTDGTIVHDWHRFFFCVPYLGFVNAYCTIMRLIGQNACPH